MPMPLRIVLLSLLLASPRLVMAAEAVAVSPSASIAKTLLGLGVVLAVLALVAWLLKRFMPGVGGHNALVRVVGSASVGAREKVVVVEVGGRWLVVGVGGGQVSALANLDIGDSLPVQDQANHPAGSTHPAFKQPLVQPFAKWLKQSAAKFNPPSQSGDQ